MSHHNAAEILFVNGVNTNFGGASVRLNRDWVSSMSKAGFVPRVIDSVPTFGLEKNGLLLKILLAFYFLPGSLFRVSRFPGIEPMVKLSPLLLIRILQHVRFRRPGLVLFSHHSMFLYGLLLSRRQRVFVVHDLLYVRARSMGYSRSLCKVLFRLECLLYSRASYVLVLSESEARMLRAFLAIPVKLVSCIDSVECSAPTDFAESKRIALVSDWRRPENLHGVLEFFSKNSACPSIGNPQAFVFYGFGSESAAAAVAALPGDSRFTFLDGGRYRSIADIGEACFLVPIYLGAGIKTKVLEAFDSGRFVVGTRAAFVGLTRAALKEISLIVATPDQIRIPLVDRGKIRDVFRQYYFSRFDDFGLVVREIFSET